MSQYSKWHRRLFAGLLLSLLSPAAVNAAIVFSDTFEDGGRTDGADPADITWYRANQNLTLNVVADSFAGGGSLNALAVDVGGIDAFKRIVGLFPSTTLGSGIGDSLKLTFAMRATNLVSNANGFRFGLYNSAGSVISADETNTSNNAAETNDFGYYVRIPTGTPAGPTSLLDEPFGDNTMGGTTGGTSIVTGTPPNVAINDTVGHLFALTLTRTSATSIGFQVELDSNVIATGSDTAAIVTTFDEVYFGTGATNNFDYVLDNVQLEAIAVPEPTWVACFAAVAGLGLWRRTKARV